MSAALESIRPLASPDLLEHVRRTYSIGGIELTMDLGGSRNLNLLITTGSGLLLVRAYRNGMTLDRLTAIQAVQRALHAKGIPTSVVVRTRTAESWSRYVGQLIEVEEYVEHSARLDSWDRLAVALPTLGRMHSVLRAVNVSPAGQKPPVANYLGMAELQEWTPRAVRKVESWSLGPEPLRFVQEAERLVRRLHGAGGSIPPLPPAQLVHGNFWGANVLFRSGKVVLVTDWDFLAERPRTDDLALTLYFASSTLPGGGTSDRMLQRLRALVDAYDEQLEVRLTPAERNGLPLALARAPLSSMRYIAQSQSASEARHLIANMGPDLEWATSIVDDLPRWQRALS
jgi:Ser/Thr protein kinase RdoA (MazF antagonist)